MLITMSCILAIAALLPNILSGLQTESDVRSMYEMYPFPPMPVEESDNIASTPIPRAGAEMTRKFIGPSHLVDIAHYVFAGRIPKRRPFKVLFAGGGTGTGTILLLNQLRAQGYSYEAVHFDLSFSSIGIAKARAKRVGHYGIRGTTAPFLKSRANASLLSFVQGSLLNRSDIEALRVRHEYFDYIDCVGVLMATEDPSLALRNLRSLLNPHGPAGMGIMLYGTYGRAPVYQIRRSMQIIASNRGPLGTGKLSMPSQLRILRRLLVGGGNYWSRAAGINMHGRVYADNVPEYDDVSLADTYLHPIDRSFTVPEVFALADQADLRIAGFTVPAEYAGETIQHKRTKPKEAERYTSEVIRAMKYLPWRQRLELGEVLDGTLERHEFFVVPSYSTDAPPEVSECGEAVIVPRVHLSWLKENVMPEVREKGRIVIPSTKAGHSKRIIKLPRRTDRQIAGRIITLMNGILNVEDMYEDINRVFGSKGELTDCDLLRRFRNTIDHTMRVMLKAGYAVVNVKRGADEWGQDGDMCTNNGFWTDLISHCKMTGVAHRRLKLVRTASKLLRLIFMGNQRGKM